MLAIGAAEGTVLTKPARGIRLAPRKEARSPPGVVSGKVDAMTMRLAIALAAFLVTGAAAVADPIEGVWKRQSTGALIEFSRCGGEYCGVVQTGEFTGQSIGRMAGANGRYKGTITDLAEGKTYKGKASISGNTMKLSGCVAFGIVCKGEDWIRQ